MSIPLSMLPHRAAWSRRGDATLVLQPVPFTAAITRTSPTPLFVVAEAPYTAVGLTVAVTGMRAGSPATETLALSNTSRFARSRGGWESITQIASAAPTGGTIAVRTIYGSGQEATVPAVLEPALPGRLWQSRLPIQSTLETGPTIVSRFYFATNELTVRGGDSLTIDGLAYEVETAQVIYDAKGPHHCRAVLQLWPG